jgi:ABC-type multidrug transport system ATPase subunit
VKAAEALLNATPKTMWMKITLTNVGKRFNRDWIFRHINYEFTNGHSYAIIGPNGSGKSTLFQVIAGAMAESEGKVSFQFSVDGSQSTVLRHRSSDEQSLPSENFYRHISIAAPYMELIEEMSLAEFLQFHQIFKPFISGINVQKIIAEIGLEKSAHKHIRYFSSGMKQRVKLAQAIFSDTPVLLLDEPCTNLDEKGIALYHQLIKNYCTGRVVIISSNDEQEYGFCEARVNIMDYK